VPLTVKLLGDTENASVSFRLARERDGGRVEGRDDGGEGARRPLQSPGHIGAEAACAGKK